MKTGIELISEERKRQFEKEGYTIEGDKDYDAGELAFAAAAYALPEHANIKTFKRIHLWPWRPEMWKPGDRIRELSKAGALIAAEIDRLQNLNQ